MQLDLTSYDSIIVYFSGGKDSLACVLHLIESGVDMSKVELWHHDVDGREGSNLKMDWPVTRSYCQAVADELGIPIYFSWKVGGFEREMLRENSLTAPTKFEVPGGEVRQFGGVRGKKNTRRKFPQVATSLSARWCSAYLKIDVGDGALRNQKRFNGKRTLAVSGERAEESASRARYATFEPERVDNRNGRNARHIDRWRPVHGWSEQEVWAIIERHKINPHPAYRLRWGRLSCQTCIFINDDQWASAAKISPEVVEIIANYEREFKRTIHRTRSVTERVKRGTPYQMDDRIVSIALSEQFNEPVIVNDWKLPAGAFGDSCGPT